MTCKNCGMNHAKGRCPPKKDNRAKRQREARARESGDNTSLPLRGMPIAGTGKPAASAKSTT